MWIFDSTTDSFSSITYGSGKAHSQAAIAAAGKYVLIGGGAISATGTEVEIYDTEAQTWSLEYLRLQICTY